MPFSRMLLILAFSSAMFACEQGSDNKGRGPAPLTETDRDAIKGGVARLDKALLARDWATAASIYTEDGMALPPNARAAQGRSAVQQLFSGFPEVRTFKQDVVEIEGYGNLAIARATYDLELIPPGSRAPVKESGKVLAVWHKQGDGSWQVARALWNSDGGSSLTPVR